MVLACFGTYLFGRLEAPHVSSASFRRPSPPSAGPGTARSTAQGGRGEEAQRGAHLVQLRAGRFETLKRTECLSSWDYKHPANKFYQVLVVVQVISGVRAILWIFFWGHSFF